MTMKRLVDARVLVALLGLLAGLALLAVLTAQDVRAQDLESKASGTNGPEVVYALNANNQLLRFDGDNPENIQRRISVKGLRGDDLVGVDFRTANRQLYGLGERGNVYRIGVNGGQATRTGQLRTESGRRVALRGNNFGVDFNPTVDALRVVSDADQNLRVNVDTGETTVDPNLRYGGGGKSPAVTGVAYTNSQGGAFGGSTKIFYTESDRDRLVTAADANSGVISTVGRLRVSAGNLAGFDIVTRNGRNAAYAALQPSIFESGFYNVDRTTGQARRIDDIGANSNIRGIAIPISQR